MPQNERIREFRKHLGLTQAEFGRKLGIVQGHLTGIESGRKSITKKTLKVICATYGVSEEWLKTGNGEMFAKRLDKKANRVIGAFCELNFEFQDYIIMQIQSILELQKKQISSSSAPEKLPKKK